MKRFYLSIILFFVFYSVADAQYRPREIYKDFTFEKPTSVVSKSLYDKIRLVDLRKDKQNIGVVQMGVLNKPNTLVFKPSLSTQLTDIIDAATDSTAEQGELVLFLRKLNFSERTAACTEEGFCTIDAELFAKQDSNFYMISSIEKLIRVEFTDVTKSLLDEGSSTFVQFIQNSLRIPVNGKPPLSYNEIVYADSIAKRKINIYNTTNFKDGAYLTYNSFKNQVPDFNAVVVKKKDKIKSVLKCESNGIYVKVFSKDVYALVTDGKPYIATEYGFYPLSFKNDEFSFIGKLSAPTSRGDVSVASFLSGIVGGVVGGIFGAIVAEQTNSKAYFLTNVNYKNGEFIRIRELTFGVDDSEEQ